MWPGDETRSGRGRGFSTWCLQPEDSVMTAYTNLEKFYNIVFDQQFSPGGKHLATCDNFGQIAVFSLVSALGATNGKTPTQLIKAHVGPAYCLETADTLLVSGGEEGIKAWKWEDMMSSKKTVEPLVTLQLPTGILGVPDTNGLVYDKQACTLYSGCGDNNVHAWDLNTEQLKATYSGHTDYVHCVCMRSGSSNQFVSGAEDGTVRMWDPSSSRNPVCVIKPKGSGDWIGCVAIDSTGDWMVCGGSIAPCIYHLSSLSKLSSLEVPKDVATQGAIFAKERIITVGSEPYVRHWTVNGDSLPPVPCSHNHAFSVAFNTGAHQYEVLSVSGDSSNIHVFTNLGYKAFSLTVTAPA